MENSRNDWHLSVQSLRKVSWTKSSTICCGKAAPLISNAKNGKTDRALKADNEFLHAGPSLDSAQAWIEFLRGHGRMMCH